MSQSTISGNAQASSSIVDTLTNDKTTVSTDQLLANTSSIKNTQLQALVNTNLATTNSTTVTTEATFKSAISNSSTTTVVLGSDLTLTSVQVPNHDVTIDLNGHTLYLNTTGGLDLKNGVHVTIENGTVDGAGISNNFYGSDPSAAGGIGLAAGTNTLTLDGVTMNGGTMIMSRYYGDTSAQDNTVEIAGTTGKVTTINATNYTNDSGSTVTARYSNNDSQGTMQIFPTEHMVVDKGATLNLNGNGNVNYNVSMKGTRTTRTFTVNGTLNASGATSGNILMDQSYYGNGTGSAAATDDSQMQDNTFTVGPSATVDLTATHFNVALSSGNWHKTQTVNIDNNANVDMTVTGKSSDGTKGDGNIILLGDARGYEASGTYTGTKGVRDHYAENPTGVVNINPGAYRYLKRKWHCI